MTQNTPQNARMRPQTSAKVMRRRRVLAAAIAVIVIAGIGVGVAYAFTPSGKPAPSPSATPTATATPTPSPTPTPTPTPVEPEFDKTARSIDDPTSMWVVSNKLRPLNPIDYVPADLVKPNIPFQAVRDNKMRAEAATALEQMVAAAAAEGGGTIIGQNAYRSYASQQSIHNRLVASLGKGKARAQSAVPGYSEHQTGLSTDLLSSPQKCNIQACFGQTTQGVWLAENSWRFGFILRYPEGKQDVTGYIYEPWHFRYVGVELSTEMHDTGFTTLEEFFGLGPAPDYAPGV